MGTLAPADRPACQLNRGRTPCRTSAALCPACSGSPTPASTWRTRSAPWSSEFWLLAWRGTVYCLAVAHALAGLCTRYEGGLWAPQCCLPGPPPPVAVLLCAAATASHIGTTSSRTGRSRSADVGGGGWRSACLRRPLGAMAWHCWRVLQAPLCHQFSPNDCRTLPAV